MNQLHIVTLVHSLTPSEKQHFKKSNDPSSDFVLLFDYINKAKDYQSPDAKEFLSKKKKKSYSSGHLSVIKNYLQEKIMESLRTQYIPKRATYEMMSRAINVDILLEKGLYSLAKNEVEQAKKRAQHSVFPIEKLIFFRRESLIHFYTDYADIQIDDIKTLFEKRLETAAQLILEIKYAQAIAILSNQYFKGNKDLNVVNEILEADYMKDTSLQKDFATQYLFYWVHSQCAEFKKQPNQAIIYFEKAIFLWIENPDYIKIHPRIYLSTCFTYLKYILQQRKSTQLILKETDLKLLLSKIPKLQLPQDVALKWEQLFIIGQLIALRKENNYKEIIQLSDQILDIISESEFTTDFTRILVYYILSIAHFKSQNFKDSNDLIITILHDNKIELRSNPEYFNHIYLVYLANLYELNNFKFLKFEIQKTKQIFKTHQQLYPFEDYFLKMMGQLISKKFSNEPDKVFDRFLKRMEDLPTTKNTTQSAEYQIVTNWIKAKSQVHF